MYSCVTLRQIADLAGGPLHDRSKRNIAAAKKIIDRGSSQPGMHKRRKGIVKAMQAVGRGGSPPYFV